MCVCVSRWIRREISNKCQLDMNICSFHPYFNRANFLYIFIHKTLFSLRIHLLYRSIIRDNYRAHNGTRDCYRVRATCCTRAYARATRSSRCSRRSSFSFDMCARMNQMCALFQHIYQRSYRTHTCASKMCTVFFSRCISFMCLSNQLSFSWSIYISTLEI